MRQFLETMTFLENICLYFFVVFTYWWNATQGIGLCLENFFQLDYLRVESVRCLRFEHQDTYADVNNHSVVNTLWEARKALSKGGLIYIFRE